MQDLDGPSKSRSMKMQDVKIQDMKLQDFKILDTKIEWHETIANCSEVTGCQFATL